jgi:hypothetical protein
MSSRCYKCKPLFFHVCEHLRTFQQFSTMEHLKLVTLTFVIAFRICTAASVSDVEATRHSEQVITQAACYTTWHA